MYEVLSLQFTCYKGYGPRDEQDFTTQIT